LSSTSYTVVVIAAGMAADVELRLAAGGAGGGQIGYAAGRSSRSLFG